MSGAAPKAESAPEPKFCAWEGWDWGVGDHGVVGRSLREGTREWIMEGREQPQRDVGLGEPGTGCRWSTGKTGFFFSPKLLEIAKQGEIMQNILQKDPCP